MSAFTIDVVWYTHLRVWPSRPRHQALRTPSLPNTNVPPSSFPRPTTRRAAAAGCRASSPGERMRQWSLGEAARAAGGHGGERSRRDNHHRGQSTIARSQHLQKPGESWPPRARASARPRGGTSRRGWEEADERADQTTTKHHDPGRHDLPIGRGVPQCRGLSSTGQSAIPCGVPSGRGT